MATWKKIIVSGSSAELDSLSLDTALPVSSGGTGASSLTDGGVLLGSGTGAVTALGQATNGQLIIGSTGGDPVLSTITQGSGVTITNSAGGITIAAAGSGGSVTSIGGQGTVNGLTLTGTVTTSGSITLGGTLANVANSALSNDSVTIGSTEVELGATAASLAGLTNISNSGAVADSSITGSFTGSFAGEFTGTTDLPDLTDGNGIADFTYDGSSTATVAVEADGSTLSVGSGGVKVADAGITATQIATSVAGDGLAGGGGTALSVNVDDSSIEINTDSLRVKALGVTNAMLAGSIANAKLANSTISGVALGSNLNDLTVDDSSLELNSGTTYNGSAARTINVKALGITNAMLAGSITAAKLAGSIGNDKLSNSSITFSDGSNDSPVSLGGTLTIQGTANEITVAESAGTYTISQPNDVTIGQDLLVTRNLTVQGTASFQHTEDLDVADRFIRMASGSTTNGDGGIAVQQTSATNSEGFGYDSATTRWGITGSFDPSQNALAPDAFMAAVVEGAASDPSAVIAKYTKKGNIFIAANEEIYIYS